MKVLWKSSIARSILGSFLIVIIPITIISLLVNYMGMRITQNEVSRSYDNSLRLLSKQLDDNLKKFETLANVFSTDTDLSALNQSPNDTIIPWDYVALLKQLKFFSATNELDSNITIYLRNKERAFSSKHGIDKIKQQDNINLYDNGSDYMGSWRFKKLSGSNTEVLSFMQTALYDRSERNIVITVDIDTSQIRNFLGNLNIQGGGTCFLIDSKGDSIQPDNKHDVNIEYLKTSILELKKMNGQFTYSQGRERYRISFENLSRDGLTIGMYIPESQIIQPILHIRFWIIIILITSLCLALFFTFFSYRNIILPIQQLIKSMLEVSKGNFKVRIPNNKKEELGFMYTQFNLMVDKIDSLINEVYEERVNVQKSKLKLLQSQINPHFLYNCLNFIYRMAGAENLDGISKMSLYLGKYFRFATRVDKDVTSIKEELENIGAYIQIQNLRYQGKISYYEDIEPKVLDVSIPRLLIQPVIENALIHGIEKIQADINIWTKAVKIGDEIIVTIEDDGSGMDALRLEEINKNLNEANQDSNSFGLSNIYWRLKLKFGDEAGLCLEKREPKGTKVVITIPHKEA